MLSIKFILDPRLMIGSIIFNKETEEKKWNEAQAAVEI